MCCRWWRRVVFRCFFWSVCVFANLLRSRVYPPPVLTLQFAVIVVGVLLFASVIGQVGSLIAHADASGQELRDKMDELNEWFKHKKGVSSKLKVRWRWKAANRWVFGGGCGGGGVAECQFPCLVPNWARSAFYREA